MSTSLTGISRLGRLLRVGFASGVMAAAVVPLTAEAAHAAGSPCPATPDKCYSFTISTSPAQPQPGQSATYTGKLSNLSKGGTGVQLGAANITWSPSTAFNSVTPGSVSPQGSETVSGTTIQLRNLNSPPGSVVTFTFQAVALRAQTVTFSSTAKQSNNYSGTGNDLTQTGASPTVTISGSCNGTISFNAYGCAGILKSAGGTVSTGSTDSSGHPSVVTAAITLPPVTPLAGSPSIQLMALRSYLSGDVCPASPLSCSFSVQLLNVLDAEYDASHPASMTIACGTLCGATTVWFQQDEATGTTEPLPPCLPIGPVPSLLTGSTACYVSNSDGTFTVQNITHVNDWKVMGLSG